MNNYRIEQLQKILEEMELVIITQADNLLYFGVKNFLTLLISKTETFLFVPRNNDKKKIWEGTQDFAVGKSIFYQDQLYPKLKLFIKKKVSLELERHSIDIAWISKSHLMKKKLQENYPALIIDNILPRIAKLRMIKDKTEIENIKKAVFYTKKAIENLKRGIKIGVRGYELKAEFDYFLTKRGILQKAFPSIIAFDKNSCILHYSKYDQALKNSVLIDVGCKFNGYCADISRTFFISPNSLQEKLKKGVLEVQKSIIKLIQPGVTLKELNEFTKKGLLEVLKKNKITNRSRDLSKYYMHNVSHHLGLQAHDLSSPDIPLAYGNVITVEPGLYFKKLGFGIRIEDDILVKEKGNEVL